MVNFTASNCFLIFNEISQSNFDSCMEMYRDTENLIFNFATLQRLLLKLLLSRKEFRGIQTMTSTALKEQCITKLKYGCQDNILALTLQNQQTLYSYARYSSLVSMSASNVHPSLNSRFIFP